MVSLLNDVLEPLRHIFYPHICVGCGSDTLPEDRFLCFKCQSDLPRTFFAMHGNNPLEKIFWGRIPLAHACSEVYFSKDSAVQNIIHQFKYAAQKEVAIECGRWMGKSLLNSGRFSDVDVIVPVPLHKSKQKRRGYNQSLLICRGINEIWSLPIIIDNVQRVTATSTQTRKKRIERWENVKESFIVSNSEALQNKHILLVDDVITTGATIEACGSKILEVPDVRLSIASFAFASS